LGTLGGETDLHRVGHSWMLAPDIGGGSGAGKAPL
jgi:hypothetical protein